MDCYHRYQRLGDLNSIYFFPTVLEAGNSKIKRMQIQCLVRVSFLAF